MDWLVFRDPAAMPLASAIASGHVRVLSCTRARDELRHMLNHPSLAAWKADATLALALYDRHVTLLPDPCPGAGSRLRCTDPDDQVFIDLAMDHRPASLLTHDRAVLKLSRRARVFGVQVLRLRDWQLPIVSAAASSAAGALPPNGR